MSKHHTKTEPDSNKKNRQMAVPQDSAMRQKVSCLAGEIASQDRLKPDSTTETLLTSAEKIVNQCQLTEDYKPYAAIMLANAANTENYSTVPYSRRMLMLPRCMAIVPEISILKQHARKLGYEILHADGTPSVLRVLAAGGIDAICGVACMDSLKRVFDTVRRLGAPAIAVPLNAEGCKDTETDLEMLRNFIDLHSYESATGKSSGGYLAVLQQTAAIFKPDKLAALLSLADISAISGCGSATHDPAIDFLAQDGKRLRPFITLAAAAAASGKSCENLSNEVYLAAIAIEAFHKASLVHDDIEDGDNQRYGKPTIHVACGLATAINIGDYMLGAGYAMVCRAAGKLAGAATAILADAHRKLALGQGEELNWRDNPDELPEAKNILRSYALKTSPAFEAALRMGLLLGNGQLPDESTDRAITLFCRHVGVAFQLLNDLQDFDSDKSAKRITFPLVLAGKNCTADAAAKARRITSGHVDALKQRALDSAKLVSPPAASELCVFLAELVLDNNGER